MYPTRVKITTSILAGTVLLLSGLSRPAAGEEILVFAAASLSDALTEVGRAFEVGSQDRLVFNFGGTNDLARQIRAGAPADVFFSADVAHMEDLERTGLVSRPERLDVLSNVLAIVVPRGSPIELRTASDLGKLERIALANPEAVPAGIYARTYLESLGLWDAIRAKVIPTLDVRAALAAVEAEHVDAGIVYRTDAAQSSRVRVALEVPRDRGPPIVYTLAPLAASRRKGTRAVVGFLKSASALRIYERHGFVLIAKR